MSKKITKEELLKGLQYLLANRNVLLQSRQKVLSSIAWGVFEKDEEAQSIVRHACEMADIEKKLKGDKDEKRKVR